MGTHKVLQSTSPLHERDRRDKRQETSAMTEETTQTANATTPEELKRLGFIYEYGTLATDTATKFYELAKKQAPSTLAPGIETLEGAIKAYGAPIVSKVQDVAPKVLSDVDKRVDTVVGQASTVYDKYTNTENIQAFKKSREEYLKQIEQLLDDIKAKGIQGSVKLAADNLTTTLNDVKSYAQTNLNMKDLQKTLFAKVTDLWTSITSNEKVDSVVKEGMKRVDSAKERYLDAHKKIVASPLYETYYKSGMTYLTKAQETEYYKKAETIITPYVESAKKYEVVDGLMNKCTEAAQGLNQHLKPVPMA